MSAIRDNTRERTVRGADPTIADAVRTEWAVADPTVAVRDPKGARFWGLLRISIGWVFLWAFLDRLLALGFSTGRNPETGVVDRFGDAAWINGGSPTEGFLSFGLHTKGVFADFYGDLAGQAWVDWAYMLSMVLIGTALILGVATRLAAAGGILWMALFYTASAIWPEHNPFMDDHVIYAIALTGIAVVGAGRYLGLGRRWEELRLVQRYPILK
jgi:thiosulfate dehydrogenase [quinone] large subunit